MARTSVDPNSCFPPSEFIGDKSRPTHCSLYFLYPIRASQNPYSLCLSCPPSHLTTIFFQTLQASKLSGSPAFLRPLTADRQTQQQGEQKKQSKQFRFDYRCQSQLGKRRKKKRKLDIRPPLGPHKSLVVRVSARRYRLHTRYSPASSLVRSLVSVRPWRGAEASSSQPARPSLVNGKEGFRGVRCATAALYWGWELEPALKLPCAKLPVSPRNLLAHSCR